MDDMTNPDAEVIDQTDGAAEDGQAAGSYDNGEVDNNTEDDSQADGAGAEVDTEEIEIDGKRYAIPKELKDSFLMHGDYTRKTQEVADQRRALEQERQQFTQRQERMQAHMQDYARLTAVSEQLAQFDQVDWQALNQEDPQQAQALFFQRQQLANTQQQLSAYLSHAEQQFALEKQQETAKRIEQGRAVLAKEIPGWSEELAGKIKDFGVQVFGSADAMGRSIDLHDPANIKLLNLARIGFEAQQKATQKPKPTQSTPVPVTKVGGSNAPAKRDMNSMSTDDWMRARNEQIRKKGR